MTSSVRLLIALAILQSAPGSLMVTIVDSEEAVLPGAVISLAGPVERQTFADGEGRAEFTQLPPGRYQLTATLVGFADYRALVEVVPSTATRHRAVTKYVGTFDPVRGRYLKYQIVTGCDTPPPATLQKFWGTVAVVARVRVEDQQAELSKGASPHRVINTRNRLRVLEVFKSPHGWPRTGTLAEVVQVGGEIDRGDYIQIVQPQFPLLGIGREYVLFLDDGRSGGWGWYVAFCAEGALALEANRVAPVGRGELSRTWQGKPRDTLIDALRKLRRSMNR